MNFSNTHSSNSESILAEEGPDYGCIELARNPEWLYFQVKRPGDLEFFISQTSNSDGTGEEEDVDFIVWGPFSEHLPSKIENLTTDKIIDCSYQNFSEENVYIQNAKQGQIYIFLVLNYSNKPGFISIQQQNVEASNAGSTDCSVLDGILGANKSVCGESSYTLDATSPGATSYSWFKFNLGSHDFEKITSENSSDLVVTNGGIYRVVVDNGAGKASIEDEVKVQFTKPPIIKESEEGYTVCFTNIPSLDLTSKTEELLSANSSPDNKIVLYYRSSEDVIGENYIINTTDFESNKESVIYANILDLKGGCYSDTVAIPVTYLQWPKAVFLDSQDVCVNSEGRLVNPLELSADLGIRFNYSWSNTSNIISENATILINEVSTDPNYVVTLIDTVTGCSKSYSTKINYHTEPQDLSISIDRAKFGNDWDISVEGLSYPNRESTYVYSLDGGTYSAKNQFKNISKGKHILRAKEINGCGSVISKEFTVIGYASFFTPNGDTYNDFWQVTTDDDYKISNILIFNRYGQFLTKIDPEGEGWDGNLNGKQMPQDTYWFRLNYIDPISGKESEFMGYFALKR
ncbi:T9SS type B sorting domain-containing protein [Zunongwangia sp.]|uniref:T9SS type B sorting domain-containing protein n=1 Tax=Zunongwangia sp. TaxID=1965325 RepID=UPI003AA9E20E